MLRFVGWLAYLWWKWWIKPPLAWYWWQSERALPYVKRFWDWTGRPRYTYTPIRWPGPTTPSEDDVLSGILTFNRHVSAQEYDELVRRFRERHS